MTNPTRPDPYSLVHRGLRLMLAQLAERVATTDDPARAGAAIDRALGFLDDHARVEDALIAPLIERASPDLAPAIAADHETQRAHHRALRAAILEGADRAGLSDRLFALIEVEFQHMRREELEVLPRLHAAIPDADLAAIQPGIRELLPSARVLEFLELMVPVMSLPERRGLEASVAAAPAALREAVEALLARFAVIPHVEEALAFSAER